MVVCPSLGDLEVGREEKLALRLAEVSLGKERRKDKGKEQKVRDQTVGEPSEHMCPGDFSGFFPSVFTS